jgi:predicted site-specific integrase-resolvase
MPDILDGWITEKDFAEAVGVSMRTVKRWRQLGTGPKHTQAGKKLILHHRDDVEDWLNNGGLAAPPASVARRPRR